ncbi:MAG: hypothetical protein WDO69_20220 [Pseudomonadota bacterium]
MFRALIVNNVDYVGRQPRVVRASTQVDDFETHRAERLGKRADGVPDGDRLTLRQ